MRRLSNALMGLALAVLLPAAVQAQSRKVTIVNHSGQSLYNFYASNTSKGDWPDLMGEDDVIIDGEEKTIDLDDGTNACRFDLRAVFKNGRTVTAKAVDACKLSQWVFDGYGHNELVYDNFKAGPAAATAERRPAESSTNRGSGDKVAEFEKCVIANASIELNHHDGRSIMSAMHPADALCIQRYAPLPVDDFGPIVKHIEAVLSARYPVAPSESQGSAPVAPAQRAEPATEYRCNLEGKNYVVRVGTNAKTTMTIDGIPVQVTESSETDPMMEGLGYTIVTANDRYGLALPEEREEHPVLERYVPNGLMSGTNPRGVCTVS